MKRYQSGSSTIKLLFLVAILVALVSIGFQLLSFYQTSWSVQDVFDNISRKMVGTSEAAIRKKLPALFKINYIDHDDVPEEFYDNLLIKVTSQSVEISSSYTETLWPLGQVGNLDEDGTYDPLELTGLDVLRDMMRYDLYFEPFAETP